MCARFRVSTEGQFNIVAKNPELDRLRREIARKQRNVNAKINRIEKSTGINLRGTNYNPRNADAAKFMRYTAKQLIAYGKRLDEFTDRKTAFVPGVDAQPIPKQHFDRYKALEDQINGVGDRLMGVVGGFEAPGSGMTIAERDATLRANRKRAQGDVVNRTFSKIDRKSTDINGVDALNKLVKSLEKKLNAKHLPSKIKEGRKQNDQMLEAMGANDLREAADKLTDFQFHVLWEYTNYASQVGLSYGVASLSAANSEDRWYQKVIEDNSGDIREAIEWARKLPPTEADARRAQGKNKPRR